MGGGGAGAWHHGGVSDAPRPTAEDHTHLVDNGKRRLTLDELGRQQPGMDRLMAEVGPRMHRLYHAGLAGNWPLATYFYRSMVKQLHLCVQSRPRYDPQLTAFIEEDCRPILDAMRGRDTTAFRTACDHAVSRANELHAFFGKPWLVWRCPAEPPVDLDLTAGMEPR